MSAIPAGDLEQPFFVQLAREGKEVALELRPRDVVLARYRVTDLSERAELAHQSPHAAPDLVEPEVGGALEIQEHKLPADHSADDVGARRDPGLKGDERHAQAAQSAGISAGSQRWARRRASRVTWCPTNRAR